MENSPKSMSSSCTSSRKGHFNGKNLPHWKTTAPDFFFRCLGGNFIRIFKYLFDVFVFFLPTFLRALEGFLCEICSIYIFI